MQTEMKQETALLAQEAARVYSAISEHNLYLEGLEKHTTKVEGKSMLLSQKLLRTMREIRKDGRNTIIATLTLTTVLLLFYLL
ncbi:hypothetical protein NEDG_02196 [Nematocida displodere]|uniref:Uncharacterized protein n=1 Tax=Nematocida displodere TaxID=1805483 RepID=A0A177EG90_9MICR|nr:hypothetical protein NEDG_02196 [Nematocida displodere]